MTSSTKSFFWNVLSTTFILLFSISLYAQTTVNFGFTSGPQTWVVPPCVTSINVVVAGGEGGGANGGNGAVITATLAVTPGQTLQLNVGGSGSCPNAGWNGGGSGIPGTWTSCGGGGASDIRIAPYNIANRIVVAGGGGGQAGGTPSNAAGGAGGCASGASGTSSYGSAGTGGTQVSGGSGGTPYASPGTYGQAGSLGQGGQGGTDNCTSSASGGGGGGGYYGGGGGGPDCISLTSYIGGGGGGGGSSFVPAGAACSAGSNNGPGYITITYTGGSPVGTASNTGPYCEGDMIQLNATGGTTYAWTGPGGWTSSAQNPTIPSCTVANGGTYDVTISSTGCSTTESTTVVVNPMPSVNAVANQTICSGNMTTAINFSGGPAGTTYDWTNSNTATGAAASGTGNIPAFTGTASVGTEVSTFTVTPSLNGCVGASITFTITVSPTPSVNPITSQQICAGDLSAAVNFTGTAASYNWTNDNTAIGLGASGSGNIPAFTTTNPGATPITGNIVVTPTAGSCTGATQTFSFTINPLPTINAGTDQTICVGDNVTLSGTGGTSYVWDNGVTNGSPFSPAVGTVTYTVVGTDAYGCSNSDQVDVTVNPLPNVNAGSDQTICEGDMVTLNGSGAQSYTWSNGVTNGGPFAPPAGSTNYTVTGTDINGCVNTDQMTVTAAPAPNVNAGANFTICEGEVITLSASGATIYQWDNGVTNGVPFTQAPGTVTYTVIGTDGNGCTNTDDITVTVEPTPNVVFEANVFQGCEPLDVTFTNNTAGSMSTCLWNFGDGTTATQCGTVTHTYDASGTYTVSLVVNTINGCTSSATYTNYIYVEDVPNASFVPSSSQLTAFSTTVEFINGSTGATSYQWDFGDGSAGSTEPTPTHTFPDVVQQTYIIELVAMSPLGCSDTAYQGVSVFEDLIYYIPNTFTPDGDEFNQTFKPIFTSGFDANDYNMYIFNRWGEIVWESHDPETGWDGTYKAYGKFGIVPDGVYVWKIDFQNSMNDARQEITGNVNLIR